MAEIKTHSFLLLKSLLIIQKNKNPINDEQPRK